MQACDLVPIVEPEILIDGEYDIQRSSAVSQEVLQVCHAHRQAHDPSPHGMYLLDLWHMSSCSMLVQMCACMWELSGPLSWALSYNLVSTAAASCLSVLLSHGATMWTWRLHC